jgi:hypothetical protein
VVTDELLTEAAQQDGVVLTRQARAAGLHDHHVRALLQQRQWLPLLRGSYLVEPERVGVPLVRSWARSAVLTVPGAVIGVGTAAVLHGLDGVPRRGVVEVVVGRGAEKARRRLLEPHAFVLGAGDVVRLGGLPVTSPVRTLADLVPRLPRLDGIAVLDSALRTGLATPLALTAARDLAAGRPGCSHVADLWQLADARAESVLESRARLCCVDGGVPPDVLQLEVPGVFGRRAARVDLAFTRRRRPSAALPLLLEADGAAVHGAPEALHRDRWRSNALVARGYDVLRCTWQDTLVPERIPRTVLDAL